jgi:hypothetical protein
MSGSLSEKFQLDNADVAGISSFFTELLAEIKHRGAFEQVWNGSGS